VYRTQTEEEEDIADKRRLFFVALTRARDTAIVTYSKLNDTGREQLPTRFLSEIEPELVEKQETTNFENSYRTKPDMVNEPKPAPRTDEAAFIRERFTKLSVSALNNYLECPWKFFYLNLIYLPEGKNLSAHYGTAVHKALEHFFNLYRKGAGSAVDLVTFFIEELEKTDINKRDYDDVHKQGEKELTAWYEKWKGTWPREAIFERKIIISYNNLELTGQIDKIERLSSGGVRVVDYKTGKPKSRNELLGNTKNADGNYLRQLAFYKLLLNHYEGGKYQMEEGLIDFIKPKENGSYELQTFTLDEIPYKEMLATLDTAIEDIRNFGFANRYCDNKDCKYCDLRKQITS
jgi:DNA helicase-2/ATP-dependent DNA helicase PcrA